MIPLLLTDTLPPKAEPTPIVVQADGQNAATPKQIEDSYRWQYQDHDPVEGGYNVICEDGRGDSHDIFVSNASLLKTVKQIHPNATEEQLEIYAGSFLQLYCDSNIQVASTEQNKQYPSWTLRSSTAHPEAGSILTPIIDNSESFDSKPNEIDAYITQALINQMNQHGSMG